MIKRIYQAFLYFAVVLLIGGSMAGAKAATVGFEPDDVTLKLADEFEITIVGTLFPDEDGERLAGGTIDFSYDPNIVDIESVTVNDTLFAFTPQSGTDDDRDGTWGTIAFDRDILSPAAYGNFIIATITGHAINNGETGFTILDSSFFGSDELQGNIFGQELFPEHTVADITVVPIPAAIWLFTSGLIGLSRFARRRQSD